MSVLLHYGLIRQSGRLNGDEPVGFFGRNQRGRLAAAWHHLLVSHTETADAEERGQVAHKKGQLT